MYGTNHEYAPAADAYNRVQYAAMHDIPYGHLPHSLEDRHRIQPTDWPRRFEEVRVEDEIQNQFGFAETCTSVYFPGASPVEYCTNDFTTVSLCSAMRTNITPEILVNGCIYDAVMTMDPKNARIT